jgi:D-amino-acid dehydrogenase
MLGWVSGLDGLAVGNGLGPSGLTIGPLAGRLWRSWSWARRRNSTSLPYDPLRASSATEAGGADAIR